MKKNILFTLFIFFNIALVKAQEKNNDRQQKLQALYVAFVTNKLNLTTDEAQKFWPVHTMFVSEIKNVKSTLPELEKQQAVLNIKKKYHGDFSNILGNDRTERFFKINAEFTQKLLERIKKQRTRPNSKSET